jgi:membrane-associated protease RseP (regulator of RpoE activity)
LVWSLLLFIHEGGHAWSSRLQGHFLESITVGAGPAIWRGSIDGTPITFRLVPVVGVTKIAGSGSRQDAAGREKWEVWRGRAIILVSGVIATALFALLVAAFVAVWERTFGSRTRWGRMIVADAIVLTAFNFLPVPPMDGGRAVLGTLATWRGTPLSGDALFWVQVTGLALSIIPMTLWTRWTSIIDRAAFSWKAPRA